MKNLSPRCDQVEFRKFHKDHLLKKLEESGEETLESEDEELKETDEEDAETEDDEEVELVETDSNTTEEDDELEETDEEEAEMEDDEEVEFATNTGRPASVLLRGFVQESGGLYHLRQIF